MDEEIEAALTTGPHSLSLTTTQPERGERLRQTSRGRRESERNERMKKWKAGPSDALTQGRAGPERAK